ncbi:MAG: glycine zipper family protein, partial [Nannocystaceae bacterium]
EGVAEGAAEGAAEGLAEGAAEGMADGAAEGAEGLAGGIGFMNLLGIGRVPVTVVLSLLTLFSWALCYIGMSLSVDFGLGSGVIVSSGVFVASLFASSMITSVAVRPLFPLFKLHLATRNTDLVGKTCEVSTGRVDARFGQAVLKGEDGGELLIQVRAETPNILRRGSQAVICGYDPQHEEFQIEGLDNLLPASDS